MSQHKYIRVNTGFIVWPRDTSLFHSHVARFCGEAVISAGFCRFDPVKNSFTCFGRSESLAIASKPEDSELLTAFFVK